MTVPPTSAGAGARVDPRADPRAHDALVGFAAHCRRLGLAVPVASTVVLAEALAVLHDRAPGTGIDPEVLRRAARPVLAGSHADLALVDHAVDTYLAGVAAPAPGPAPRLRLVLDDPLDDPLDDDRPTDDPPADDPPDGDRDEQVVRWSAAEVLRHRDLAACTPAERAEIDRMVDALALDRPRRRSHRRRATRAGRGPLALRPTVADAWRHGGEPVRLHRTARVDRVRPIVLLLDVSGSMEPYSHVLLRVGHALVRSGPRVEVFALGTRLTRLTRELSGRDPDAALGRAAAAVVDWSGGTRLGATLDDLAATWGRRGTTRGAVVVVLSDGWDRGDPDRLSAAMARLHRTAHRVVWVNPLKASPGYAPLARGMAAALPHVDEFVEGHSFDAIERLVDLLAADPRPARRVERPREVAP